MKKIKAYGFTIALIVATSVCGFGQTEKQTIATKDKSLIEDPVWTIKMFQKEEGNWFSVESNSLYVDFMEEWAWTIRNIRYMGDEIVGESGAHGSVVRMDTGPGPKDYYYIGTSHGHEIVTVFSILVDGKKVQYNPAISYCGKRVIIRKESNMGPLDHIMEITFPVSGDYIIEKHSYKVVGDLKKSFNFLFTFMHVLNKELFQWFAEQETGKEIEGKIPNVCDSRLAIESDIKMVTFYSQSMKKGVTFVYPEVYKGADKISAEMKPGTTEHFGNSIVDRKNDNKLYFRPEVKEMGYKIGETFEYSVKVIPFSANPNDWKAIGKSLAVFK
ncbi:MAG: hypothetical protein K8R35_11330 [Bacteroidales bacterium]|nr:hypothetical protein [Bacteroidales bacterium]